MLMMIHLKLRVTFDVMAGLKCVYCYYFYYYYYYYYYYYFASGIDGRSIAISVYVCLSVCLYARISEKSHVKILSNFCTGYLLPVAVTRSSSDDSTIRHVLLVLWMTSSFHIMGSIVQNQARCYVSSNSPGGVT